MWHFARTGGKSGVLYHKFEGILYEFEAGIMKPTRHGDLVTEDGRVSQYVAFGFTDTEVVHMDVQNITAASTGFMLIDLSDTTNWAHTNTGHIVLEYMIIEVDPDSNFVGEVQFGFLSDVDATDGDCHQILDVDLRRKADLIVEVIDFGSHGIHLQTAHWFGPTVANSTLFQTDVNIEGPDGATSYPSGAGDFVFVVSRSAGAVDVSITLGYETVA